MGQNNINNDSNNNNDNKDLTASRHRVLTLIESFIENILKVRRTLFGLSISALVLAPLAIVLSIFLLQDPSFFAVLEIENEFGLVLSILLGAIIIISSLWLVAGVKQYRSISSWNKRYNEYIKDKEEKDREMDALSRQQHIGVNNDNGDMGLDDNRH
jgi:hypothetical protein